ncbi:MAG: DUF1292 domain-containing protein [Lachnospiraceae bacterium]|jgi:hypothetical protein|nr:DUF1292 domain-containing protein [Lachnospiraceae bacterium]MCR5354281.1 DUF1292 domain-containing protein [Lachnospiraceae bacterium]
MDKIKMIAPDSQEEIELYVLEQTTVNQQKYLLVTEDSDGDTEAFILKEIQSDDTEITYEFVEDDVEFEAVVKIFEELVEDTDFEV